MNKDNIKLMSSFLKEIFDQRKVIDELGNERDALREIILQQFKLIEDYQRAFRIAKYDTTEINARAEELIKKYDKERLGHSI